MMSVVAITILGNFVNESKNSLVRGSDFMARLSNNHRYSAGSERSLSARGAVLLSLATIPIIDAPQLIQAVKMTASSTLTYWLSSQ